MSISLVGLTLHVADVERSLNFYKRLPNSSILFHMPGKFALLKVGSGRLGLLQDQKRAFHVEIDLSGLGCNVRFTQRGRVSAGWPDNATMGRKRRAGD